MTNIEFEGIDCTQTFIVTVSCNEDESTDCRSKQTFVDLVNLCKDSNHKISNLLPKETNFMQLRIVRSEFDENPIVIFDVSWDDVQGYSNGSISAEEFKSRVFEFNFPPSAP